MSEVVEYVIIDVYMDNLDITKFTVQSTVNNKQAAVSYSDAVQLARKNKLKNATTILDTTSGKYLLHIDGGIVNLPLHKTTLLNLTCRLVNDEQQCIGYKAKDTSGKTYKISIAKAWELASMGCINDVEAKIVFGRRSLVSRDGSFLKELPMLNE